LNGKPEDTDLTTVDFSTTPAWKKALTEHTKNVQPQPHSTNKKRKISEMGEGDNDNDNEKDDD
jgi:hypothetical protein